MMGLAGFMQLRSITEPLPLSDRLERVPGGRRFDTSNAAILNQDGID